MMMKTIEQIMKSTAEIAKMKYAMHKVYAPRGARRNIGVTCVTKAVQITAKVSVILRALHELFPKKGVPQQIPAGLEISTKFFLAWRS